MTENVYEMPVFCVKPQCDRMADHSGLCTPDLVSLQTLAAQVAEMHEMFTRMKPMFGAFTR